jgi:hypothetical protein
MDQETLKREYLLCNNDGGSDISQYFFKILYVIDLWAQYFFVISNDMITEVAK